MKKKIIVSDCCNATVHMVPPSLADPGMFFCSACMKECKTRIIYDKEEEKTKNEQPR